MASGTTEPTPLGKEIDEKNVIPRDVEAGLEEVDIERIEKVYSYVFSTPNQGQNTDEREANSIDAFCQPSGSFTLCVLGHSFQHWPRPDDEHRRFIMISLLYSTLLQKQVSTGLALFYVCYVIFDFPSNLIMSRVSPHAWMSRIVTCVGIIGMCLTAMKAAWSL